MPSWDKVLYVLHNKQRQWTFISITLPTQHNFSPNYLIINDLIKCMVEMRTNPYVDAVHG